MSPASSRPARYARAVELRLLPDPDDATAVAVADAVEAAGIDLRHRPAAYASAWRAAALGEAAHHSDPVADGVPLARRQALSPRSTRGATRA